MTHSEPVTLTAGLDQLAQAWQQAKLRETQAREYRAEIEALLIESVGAKTEGATTEKTDTYKVTTTGKMSRKVDSDLIQRAQAKLPAAVFDKYFTARWSISTASLRGLRATDSEYPVIMATFTEKPAKTSVKVEVL
jgi:hypothetical protein